MLFCFVFCFLVEFIKLVHNNSNNICGLKINLYEIGYVAFLNKIDYTQSFLLSWFRMKYNCCCVSGGVKKLCFPIFHLASGLGVFNHFIDFPIIIRIALWVLLQIVCTEFVMLPVLRGLLFFPYFYISWTDLIEKLLLWSSRRCVCSRTCFQICRCAWNCLYECFLMCLECQSGFNCFCDLALEALRFFVVPHKFISHHHGLDWNLLLLSPNWCWGFLLTEFSFGIQYHSLM